MWVPITMFTLMVITMVTTVPEAFLEAIEVDLWVLGPSHPECRVLDLRGQLVEALPGPGLRTSVPEALREVITILEAGIRHHAEVGPRGLSPALPRAPAPQPPRPWAPWSQSSLRWPPAKARPRSLWSRPLLPTTNSPRSLSPL